MNINLLNVVSYEINFDLLLKLKFATKVSLAMMLSFIIPFFMGWNQASTAMITIMLIADAGGTSDSIGKGIIRVISTLIGARADTYCSFSSRMYAILLSGTN